MKRRKLHEAIFLILFFTSYSIIQARYEVSFSIRDDNGNLRADVTVEVYYLDYSDGQYKYIGSTTSVGYGIWNFGGDTVNAAFSIGDNYGLYVPYANAQTIAFKIFNKVVRMDHDYYYYGDALVKWPSWDISTNQPCYSFDGPYDWQSYEIQLSNYMGGDAGPATKGIIHFNSLTDTTGTNSISYYREGTTFLGDGHTIGGEDNQYVNQYTRKWRQWSDALTSINRTLNSPRSYNYIANYARQMSVTYRNYYNSGDQGGTIYLDDNSQGSPASLTLYDDLQYKLEAQNTTRNSVNYTFNHWEYESSNIGSSNPLSAYEVPGHGTLQAIFDHKPVNSYRYMHFNDSEYGEPVRIMWSKHPLDSSFITQYAIWRKVKHNGVVGTPVQIATVTANASSTYQYVDNSYLITQGYTNDLLYYDVRAYYNPNSSAEDYEPVYGEMNYKIQEENNMQASLSREVPSDYNIENYPNPFNPTTKITYQLPEKSNVILKIYDALGKEVRTLVNSNKEAGYYSVDFDASGLPSGVYFYTLRAGDFVITKKMILLR